MDRIDRYLEAIRKGFATDGEVVAWPINVAGVAPYFADLEATDLYPRFRRLFEQKTPMGTVVDLLVGPSAIKSTLMDLIVGLKAAERPPMPIEDRLWVLNYIFDALQSYQHGNIFCEDGKNLILHPDVGQRLYHASPWIWLEYQRDAGRAAQRLSAATLALIWSLYFYAWPNVGFEIHGPYEIETVDKVKLLLLVREFFDVKPIMLWPDMEAFPWTSIRILTLYRSTTDLKLTIFNNLIHRDNLLESSVAVCVEANGTALNTSQEIGDVSNETLAVAARHQDIVGKMSKEEVVLKFIESRYYLFRKMRMYFGDDWRPPARIADRIHRWGLIDAPRVERANWDDYRVLFDPRNDYHPGKNG